MIHKCKITSNNITEVKENEIFVFGSNEAGIHGAGAAKLAFEKFGATYKQGFGLSGNSFALPTKDFNIQTLSIDKIKEYVDIFENIVKNNVSKHFLITEIGCGLAGYTPNDIAPLFINFINIENVSLPQSFIDILCQPKKLKVYKMTDENMVCNPDNNPFQYELNKKYTINDKIKICKTGFHSCSTPQNCLDYYNNNGKNRLFLCEVELNGNESFEEGEDITFFTKIATDNIIFLEEITNLSKAFNTGDRNTGDRNTGNHNTGDWNTGNRNTGNWNTGNWNTGNHNTGDWKTGNRNTGNHNTGDWNTGYLNTGNHNTGDWNTGNRNTGYFNTITPKLMLFNKETNKSRSEIYFPNWLYFEKVLWIYENNMTEEQKLKHPYYKTTGGCLVEEDYKLAAQKSYDKATKFEQDAIENIPNYDANILFEIFGIDRRNK